MAITRVEVTPKQGPGMRDVRGDVVRRQLASDHSISVPEVRSIVGYLVKSEIDSDSIGSRVNDLFADPIIEDATTNALMLSSTTHFTTTPDAIVTVGFKAGVTDNPGSAALDGFRTIFPQAGDASISTYITYAFFGLSEEVDVTWLANTLHNNLIERALVADAAACAAGQWPEIEYTEKPPQTFEAPAHVDMEISCL